MNIPFYDVGQSLGFEAYRTFSRVPGTLLLLLYEYVFTHETVQILHPGACYNPFKELIRKPRAILHELKCNKKSNIYIAKKVQNDGKGVHTLVMACETNESDILFLCILCENTVNMPQCTLKLAGQEIIFRLKRDIEANLRL